MTGLADPTDPHEMRRRFPDLAEAQIPLSVLFDALHAGRKTVAFYRNRTGDVALHGRRVTDIAAEVADEVIEDIEDIVFAALAATGDPQAHEELL